MSPLKVGVWNWLALYLMTKGIPQPTALRVAASRIPPRIRAANITLACSILIAWVDRRRPHSRLLGSIAGDDPTRLGAALLVIPGFAVLMCVVNLIFRRLAPGSAVPAQP